MEPLTLWHDLLGVVCNDLFGRSPFGVEAEKDLSLKKQLLDLVITRKSDEPFAERLPDGLDNLGRHNLLTFKSYQETLDAWAILELLAHFVNFRKQVSPSLKNLLPASEFRLYALAARYPRELAAAEPLVPVQPGVYECRCLTAVVRVIVLHQLPLAEHNTPLLLFSGLPEQVRYAIDHYRRRSPDTTTMLDTLLIRYREEGLNMAMTMEEFRMWYLRQHLKELTPEERLEGLPPEERLKGLPPEEVLKGFSREEIENYLKRLKNGSPPATPPGSEGSA
ncbi:MAG TPA: hypothetical protein VKA46_11465 [Gemmataceae bacterium]|nr:hypothetical protein [Gemmataceae bacterium]